MITAQEHLDLVEIQRLLDEAYDNFFDKSSDTHCKSTEGYIGLHFYNYFDRAEGASGVASVEVYSYVLGPSRTHDFRTTREALETVREWHREEMARDYVTEELEAMLEWDAYNKETGNSE